MQLDPKEAIHRTAVHEAGHAVSEFIHNGDAPFASIIPNEKFGTLGRTVSPGKQPDDDPDAVQEAVEAFIVDCFAGYAAQVHFAPDHQADALQGRRGDDELAATCLTRLPGDREANERRLRGAAAGLVSREWAAIEAVATELLRFQTLDSGEVELIVMLSRGEAAAGELERYRCLAGRHAGHHGCGRAESAA